MAISREVEKILRTLEQAEIQDLIKISDALELINGALRHAYAEARKTGDWQPYSTLKNIKKSKLEELKEWNTRRK